MRRHRVFIFREALWLWPFDILDVVELNKEHFPTLRLNSTKSKTRTTLLTISLGFSLLQELRGVSARELEACRRELEEESSRQRQHFLEEVELLKVQSEERLQDRINQLKVKNKQTKKHAEWWGKRWQCGQLCLLKIFNILSPVRLPYLCEKYSIISRIILSCVIFESACLFERSLCNSCGLYRELSCLCVLWHCPL